MSYFYHNLTKCIVNEMDIGDFIEELDRGDLVMFSISGDATLKHLDELDKYCKEQFNETLDEYGCDFDKLPIPFGRRIGC